MTEEEWLAAIDPAPMLAFLRGKVSDRKLRLFAVGSYRRIMHLIPYKPYRKAILVLERFIEGLADDEECTTAYERIANDEDMCSTAFLLHDPPYEAAFWAMKGSAYVACFAPGSEADEEREKVECEAQVSLLQDIFGNPFRPVVADRSWLTSTVVALAEGIYTERAFERLPILADALQDAGCDSGDILNHLRSEGPHVRGCWVIDLLTGRG